MSPRKKRWKTLLKLAIGLGIIGLLFWFADFDELVEVAAHANPWFLVAAAALIYIDRWLMAYKWNLLLHGVNIRVPLSALVRAYMVSPLAQVLLPSTIGADLFRLYCLSRYKVSTQGVLASIIMERVIGFGAIILLVLISSGVAFYVLRDSWASVVQLGWGVLATAAIGGGIIVGGYFGSRALMPRLAARFANWAILGKLHNIIILSGEYRDQRRTVAQTFVWTFIEQLIPVGIVYLIVQALDINASLLELVAIIPLTVLALRLPLSIDGIGVQEGLYVVLFGFIGVSPTEALLLSACKRAVQLLCAFPWAMHYLYAEKGRPSTLVEPGSVELRSTVVQSSP
jgi:uncharacterized membrane protein YbhN (UPF0104 family)